MKNLITPSLYIINENYKSSLVFFVKKIIQIQSKQLVHIMLYDSYVTT